jgi:hypothetical protein
MARPKGIGGRYGKEYAGLFPSPHLDANVTTDTEFSSCE